MKKPSVYEAYEFLHGWPQLNGQLARLYYLETPRSLKWKGSSLRMNYSEVALETGMNLMKQEGWHSFKFAEE